MYFLAFFVLVWSYPIGTTVHLFVSCSLVWKRTTCTDTWGTFLVIRSVFFVLPIACLTWHTCASLCQYGLPHFAPRLSSHLRVFEVSSKEKKYQNECSVAMMPDFFLFTSVRVSQKPTAGKKKNVDVQWFVLPSDVRNWDNHQLIIRWVESCGCFISWNTAAMCSGCLVTCACTLI